MERLRREIHPVVKPTEPKLDQAPAPHGIPHFEKSLNYQ